MAGIERKRHDFKKGSYVRCVRGAALVHRVRLTKGKIYEVKEEDFYWVKITQDDGTPNGWEPSFFEAYAGRMDSDFSEDEITQAEQLMEGLS